MPTRQFGPFPVVGAEVPTGVHVQGGDVVRVVAEGLVDFGGAVLGVGAPILNADGDSWATPAAYPAPSLRKNSLICKVGARWYQGGVDKTFTPGEAGEIILRANDDTPGDNSRGWTVSVYVTPMEDRQSQGSSPQQSQPAQQQSQANLAEAQCCCGCPYYLVPPWWVTSPPWWVTMGFKAPDHSGLAQPTAQPPAQPPGQPVGPN
jgi:hypothetical protein